MHIPGTRSEIATRSILDAYHSLVEIGIAVSRRDDIDALLETILLAAKRLANADGGTLYLVEQEGLLHYKMLHTSSLGLATGGRTGQAPTFPPLSIADEGAVAAWSARNQQSLNIPDIYANTDFDFSGPRNFDAATNYRTKSMLCVPLINHRLAERDVLRRANVGSGRMMAEDVEQVRAIAARRWQPVGQPPQPFLSENEVENLTIIAGTLTHEEREIINHHIVATIKMLEALPWPKHLRNVPEYAGGHHERMDGRGYPKGLKRDEMSVQTRMLAIADVFEALTAADRPYKPGKTLSEALMIMKMMRDAGHIDPDLFEVFVREKIYLAYADQFLPPEQVDDVSDFAL